MNPYRRHLIGLPLQRSIFSDIDQAARLIGLADVLPGERLMARLTDDGDLFLDRECIEEIGKAISDRLTPVFLDGMKRSLTAACDSVQRATECCRARAVTVDPDEARHLISDLGTSLRTLVPFGILSKFVPDVLYRALSATSHAAIPSLPSETPGATLTREAFALFSQCSDSGFTPDRLLAEWPDVPAGTANRVREFCRRQAGFGPLRWEAPGFENPWYVFGALKASFTEQESAEVVRRLRGQASERDAAVARPATTAENAVRGVLLVWLDFLERETWYVRRAFFVGLRPLLLRLAPETRRQSPHMVDEDLLFLTLDELVAPRPDMALASARRGRFLANNEYLVEHGIQDDRLARIMEAA